MNTISTSFSEIRDSALTASCFNNVALSSNLVVERFAWIQAMASFAFSAK